MASYVDKIGAGGGEGTYNMVLDGWNFTNEIAQQSFDAATALLDELARTDIRAGDTSSGFSTSAIGYTITIPPKPTPGADWGTGVTGLPTAPYIGAYSPLVPGTAPTFDTDAPNVQFLARPDALVLPVLGPAPTIYDVVLPDAPAYDGLPDEPTLHNVVIPDVPTLALPVWEGVSPADTVIDIPTVGFVWSEDYYDSALLQDVTNRLTTMLLGGTGLPAEIEQAIWDRGRSREDVIAKKATQEAYEEFAARGFSIPPGALAGRVAEVWQKNREAASTFSRDVAIKQAELEIENLKFAVSTGIQLETQLMTYAGQYAGRALEAAKTVVQVAIDILNARVAVFNARLQAYQIEAAVFRELIQAEGLKLEQYKAQIDAQKLVGEINVQLVQIYKTRVDALMVAVEVYKAQLEGVKAGVDVDRARIEAFKSQVDVYRAQVDAKSSEYQAWGESIRGEASKMSVYESSARAYAALIDAYKSGETLKIENLRADIAHDELTVKLFAEKINAYQAKVQAEATYSDSAAKIFDGEARVYASQISGETARVQALAEQVRLIIAAGTADAELKLKSSQVNIENAIKKANIETEAIKAAGAAYAQLAASAMSAVNLGASTSWSSSASRSNSLQESHAFNE